MIESIPYGPRLPLEVVPLYHQDYRAQEVIASWRHTKLERFGDMPELKTYTDPKTGNSIRYADLVPSGDIDEEHVINMRLPFGNGLAPHMYLRARLVLDLLDIPQRIRIFPNDTRKQRTTELDKTAWRKVERGNFGPIAELQQKSIDDDPDTRGAVNDNSGASFGGVMAIEQAAIAPTRSIDVFDVPTFVERSGDPKSLDKDVTGGGAPWTLQRPYNQAILDSRIPALAEAFGTRPKSARPTAKQLLGGVSFFVDTMLSGNKAIKSGMTVGNSHMRLMEAHDVNPNLAVVLSHGNGNVMPEAVAGREEEYLKKHGHQVVRFAIRGYAHEGADNAWVAALLSREARRLAMAA